MINNNIFQTNIEIIINQSLYKRNIIDEKTFIKVNEILLKELNQLRQKEGINELYRSIKKNNEW